MTKPSLINLHSGEYSQEFYYYPYAVKLDRCVGSCSTLNYLSNQVCVSNKTEDLKRVQRDYGNKWIETLTKHISCERKCRLAGKKCNLD